MCEEGGWEANVEGHRSCEELFEGLSSVADGGELDARCLEALEHCKECEPCRKYLESLKATRETLAALGKTPEFDPNETRRLLEECRKALRARMGLQDGPEPAP